jgi:hypothetical protein
VAEQGGRVGARVVPQAGVLEQAVGDVDAEAADAAVEPEPERPLEVRGHGRIAPVEVGLLGGEQVQVPPAVRQAGPRRTAEERLPVVRRLLRRRREVVPAGLGGVGVGERGPEPRVTVGGVVGDDVEDHPQAQPTGLVHQGLEIGDAAVLGVDRPVVDDVVAAVRATGGIVRVDPQCVDAQPGEVGQPGAQAGQVADAVTVAVGEGPQVDLVDHRRPPPGRGGVLGGVLPLCRDPRCGEPE